MESKMWLFYAVLAGLCWGTYVPLVSHGIRGLQSPYGSFLCVGMAYFLIAIVVPVGLLTTVERAPNWTVTGISFATLAGVAGALGALCVIFANKNVQGDPSLKLYIAPIIFALAPVLTRLRERPGAQALLAGLAALTLALTLVWLVFPGWTYNFADGRSYLLDALSGRLGVDAARFFPSSIRPRTASAANRG